MIIEPQLSHFIKVNGIKLHYLDHGEGSKPLLLLHSLSANAAVFNGLMTAGLGDTYRLIIPDMRGRGLSDKPILDYSLEEEAKDLLGLLDHLGIEQINICGHSFGGLLGVYFAAHYPERVGRLILLDSAELNPLTPFLINFTTSRLLSVYPSWEHYLGMIKMMPFMNIWDDDMLPFFWADTIEHENGMISPRSNWMHITYAAANVFSLGAHGWKKHFSAVQAPSLLIQAKEPFMYGQYIVPDEQAQRTVSIMRRCDHIKADGNHITMLFGDGAKEIVAAIRHFCKVPVSQPAAKAAAAAA
jgi:pimeloyl-ACP methyl ester carboxylesterase